MLTTMFRAFRARAVPPSVGLALLAPITTPALAQEACEPLSEAQLADRVHASLDAIQRADVEGHQAIIRDLEERLPCLEFVPSPERWAELLVGIAIVDYATKGDWQSPLTTAVHIHPTVDLLVSKGHGLRKFEVPPPPPSTGARIPDGVRIYLDGELVTELPEPGGFHLAQRRTGDGWSTILLKDAPIPADWLVEPELAKVGLRPALTVGLRFGGLVEFQRVDQPGDFFGDGTDGVPGLGLATAGTVGYGGAGGAYWDLAVPGLPHLASSYGHLGVFWPFGTLALVVGGGGQAVDLVSADRSETWLLPFPTVGAKWMTSGRYELNATAHLGWTPALTRAQLGLGVSPDAEGKRWRAGVEVLFGSATLVQDETDRAIHANLLHVGAQFGLAWGRWEVVR